ncbi:MAG: sulfatase-like hydrolase/transferase [Phycisphaerales bacterium]|jgi:hypothetical protein|nr:sulfatase-like hydrolase/transferase [Phycisphaerales bacterium]MBT7171782.1 sulfatase-like hydrolase/transferase [Phycisphaerales bacterium]
MAQKNLVVVHLESLSDEVWKIFSSEFPNLARLKEKSRSYSHFISSATSTQMTQGAFLGGRDSSFDHIAIFGSGEASDLSGDENLWTKLKDSGYRVGGMILPEIDPEEHEQFLKLKISPYCETDFSFKKSGELCSRVGEFCSSESPWAVYIHPLVAHVCYTTEDNPEELDFHEYSRRGYSEMDQLVRQLREVLENQEDDTVWLFFGDHGDSIHTHGWNFGLAHTGDPYFPLIHCPLFLTGPGIEPETKTDLVSTADCRGLILHELGINTEPLESHKTVFSQNLFANQKPGPGLNKSFSAYDGTYNLLVSLLGLEMYDCRLDPENHNNLLSFFKLQKDGTIVHDLGNLPYKKHPPKIHRPKSIEDIQTHFYALRKELSDHVDRKYDRLGKGVKYRLPKNGFKKIRKRKFYWLYPIPRAMRPAFYLAKLRNRVVGRLKPLLPSRIYNFGRDLFHKLK